MKKILLLVLLLASLDASAQTVKILGRKVVAPFCGDNIINGSETVCDGTALGSHGSDCTAVFGCTGGTPCCNGTCDGVLATALGGCTGCTGCPTADILDETFGPSGSGYAYQNSVCSAASTPLPCCTGSGTGTCGVWSEGPTGTTDEDATCPTESGGFTSQCLKTSVSGAGQTPFARWTAPTNYTGTTFITFRLDVDPSMDGVWTTTDAQMIFTADEQDVAQCTSAATPYACCTGSGTGTSAAPCQPNAFTAAAILELLYTTTAAPGDGQYCTGGTPPCWLIAPRVGGTGATPVPITPGTVYEMQYKLDSGANVGEIYLNSTLLLSNADSDGGGHGEWKYLRFGSAEGAPKSTTIYYMDRIRISSTLYVH